MIPRRFCLLVLAVVGFCIPGFDGIVFLESRRSTRSFNNCHQSNPSPLSSFVVIGADASNRSRTSFFPFGGFNDNEATITRRRQRRFQGQHRVIARQILASILRMFHLPQNPLTLKLRRGLAAMAIYLAVWSCDPPIQPAHADIHAQLATAKNIADEFLTEEYDDQNVLVKTKRVGEDTPGAALVDGGSECDSPTATAPLSISTATIPSGLLAKTGGSAVMLAAGSGTFVVVRRKKSAQMNSDGPVPFEDIGSASSGLDDSGTIDGAKQNLPLLDQKYIEARRQPKLPKEEAALAARYGAIEDVGERAYQILLDLGMIQTHN